MRDNRYFQSGSGVFSCSLCGRRTRATGDGEEDCDMCADCFHLCGEDNYYNDNGKAPDAKETANLQKRLNNIAKKGGNAEAVRGFCGYAFPKEKV